ncbi:MAG TPA: AraC family transcriptional regulator [Candidatus Limiplasma sp.]|nr:AraC family transcriptional regulator [Candidatus Limiplasma sp.]HRX07729.1 AraC family transcriptional regulator [Candidatus Limiplasma sp.]
MDWIEGLNRTLRYIEEHLTDAGLSVESAARHAAYSPFYLQRIFSGLTDMTLAEYIRSRRMSQAGVELQTQTIKVLDAALKYGYETPESFHKAFRRFHGISPSAAKHAQAKLMFMAPLQISVSLKGGTLMDYQIEKKEPMTVMGYERRFSYENGFAEVPKFWDEFFQKGLGETISPLLGISFNDDTKPEFAYMIGNFCKADAPVPDGMVKRSIPAYEWALFHTEGTTGRDIQGLNRRIYSEWLPQNAQYEPAANLNIEVYPCDQMDWADKRWGIWLPVKAK